MSERPPVTNHQKAGWIVIATALIAGGYTIVTGTFDGFEGYVPVATHERIDPRGVVTVCFGRTNYDDPSLRVGTEYDKDQCKDFLENDLPKYDAMVKRCIPNVDSFPPNRHAAIVDFTYNVGEGTLCKSSVARKLNAGDVKGGCAALKLYVYANGVKLRGLERRRDVEYKLCMRND